MKLKVVVVGTEPVIADVPEGEFRAFLKTSDGRNIEAILPAGSDVNAFAKQLETEIKPEEPVEEK
jgi:hypothetical protein